MIHPGDRDGEKKVVAVTLLGPRAHYKGLRLSIDDSLAPEHKERFLFSLRVLVFPAESQVRVHLSGIKRGVSHGRVGRPHWDPPSRRRGVGSARGRGLVR